MPLRRRSSSRRSRSSSRARPTWSSCARSSGGEIAFLTGHAPFLGALATWPVELILADGTRRGASRCTAASSRSAHDRVIDPLRRRRAAGRRSTSSGRRRPRRAARRSSRATPTTSTRRPRSSAPTTRLEVARASDLAIRRARHAARQCSVAAGVGRGVEHGRASASSSTAKIAIGTTSIRLAGGLVHAGRAAAGSRRRRRRAVGRTA